MPATNPSVIVDAIAADLLNVVTPKATRKYMQVMVEDFATELPLLNVWNGPTLWTPLTTGQATMPAAYTRSHTINVDWHIFDDAINTHGFDDPAMVQALDATCQLIINRCVTYSTSIPTLGPNLQAILRSSQSSPHPSGALWTGLIVLGVDDDA